MTIEGEWNFFLLTGNIFVQSALEVMSQKTYLCRNKKVFLKKTFFDVFRLLFLQNLPLFLNFKVSFKVEFIG